MSRAPSNWIAPLLAVFVAALLGFWLARDVVGFGKGDRTDGDGEARPPRPTRQVDHANPGRKSTPRHPSKRPIDLADLLLGTPRERIVTFKNERSYRNFLSKLDGKNLRLLGKIDGLRAARIGYDDLGDLEDLLGDDSEHGSNFLVSIPDIERPQVDAQAGAAGFGRATLEWLGITGDNSSWGKGVRIAILDTGVGKHAAFPGGIREIDLITGDGPPIDLHGHGTAVASLIVGSDNISQGIAPGADLLSIRIADETGTSSSFLLAQGIVRAVDEGAQIINISMGSYGNSALVRNAVEYAAENQVVIVAAAGNEGLDVPAYPAAYESVIAVGAVDSNGQHLNFSNTGESLDMGAPGFEIVSAWPGDQFTSFSGTSASAPLAAATIAATMTELGPLGAEGAATVVTRHLNAAGAPGDDPQFGEGIIDVGRIMNSNTPGIIDAAIASNWYEAPPEGDVVGTLQVTIENRGTTAITSGKVEVMIGENFFPITIGTLPPGGTQVFPLPVNPPAGSESISISSSLTLTGQQDSKPSNNSLSGAIVLIEPAPTEAASTETGLERTPQ